MEAAVRTFKQILFSIAFMGGLLLATFRILYEATLVPTDENHRSAYILLVLAALPVIVLSYVINLQEAGKDASRAIRLVAVLFIFFVWNAVVPLFSPWDKAGITLAPLTGEAWFK